LSARFIEQHHDGWLVPEDLPLVSFSPATQVENLKNILEEEFHVEGLELDTEAMDACVCAFRQNDNGSWLASWDTYSPEELVGIWDDLARSLARRNSSKIVEARIEDGRVLLRLGYRPIAGDPRYLASTNSSTALLDQIAGLHKLGLRHGGINERWISAGATEVFGFGLSSLYAAWRRKQGVRLGLLVADPRFASPAELMGASPSIRSDRFSLAALITASCLEKAGSPHGMPRRVQGADAFLERIAWGGSWIDVRSRAGLSVGKDEDRKLDAALEQIPKSAAFAVGRLRLMRQATLLILALTIGGLLGSVVRKDRQAESPSSGAIKEKIGAPAPTSVPAVITSATTKTASPASHADLGPRALSVDGKPLNWLTTHKEELGQYARVCGSIGVTCLVIGGDISPQDLREFTSGLERALGAGETTYRPLVVRHFKPPLRGVVLLVACGNTKPTPTRFGQAR
jgi:hypothetical protein